MVLGTALPGGECGMRLSRSKMCSKLISKLIESLFIVHVLHGYLISRTCLGMMA